MARGIDPRTHLANLKLARKVALKRNMLKEAAEVNTLIEELEAILSR